MRSPIEILNRIRLAGGTITVLDDDLSIQAPAGTLADADRGVLAEHKDQLVELLRPADPEREAIQRVEGLDAEARDKVVDQACQEWGEIAGLNARDHHDHGLHDHHDHGLQDRLDRALRECKPISGPEEDQVVDQLAERLFGPGGPVHISKVIEEVFASVGMEVTVR